METKRKRGRPFQNKIIRHYSLDKIIADFLDSLPDGERSRFVNTILRQGIEGEQISGKFYTYLLMRPDGSVFYIGKGMRSRINDHEKEARNGIQSHKCNIIRKVWAEGDEIIKQKVGFFDTEEDAYALEILLIEFFGKENLTNVSNGGEGPSRLEKAILRGIYLEDEDKHMLHFIRERYGLDSDDAAVRLAIKRVAEEIERDVPGQTGPYRQDRPTR